LGRSLETTVEGDRLLSACGLTDNLQGRVQDLGAETANVAHHPPQITSASYRSTFGGRRAWALLGCDRLLQEWISMVRSQKIIGGIVEVRLGNAPYSDGDRTAAQR